jgi:hypothetical protein
MPTPAAAAITKYTSIGLTKIYYLPSVSAVNLTPTRAEMNAGTDVSGQVADWTGWIVSGVQINTPDLSSVFESSIAGRVSAAKSSITFYASQTGVDIGSLLPRTTTGFIQWLDGGDISGNQCEVYPVTVMACGIDRDNKMTLADRVMVDFAITRQPGQNLIIP